MAKNRVFESPNSLSLKVPDGVVSGETVVVGGFAGVALTDKNMGTSPAAGGQNKVGRATVALKGAYALGVTGPCAQGDCVVATVDGTSKRVTGLARADYDDAIISPNYIGLACEDVANGITSAIPVLLKGN